MVTPHPDLQRRIRNTDGIVEADKSEFVPGLYTKYPGDYIDLNTHSILVDTQPWIEGLAIQQTLSHQYPISSNQLQKRYPVFSMPILSSDIQNLWGPFFTVIDKVLVLCVDFSDKLATVPISTINDRFFSTTVDSFLNYYKEVSYSRWIPSGEVRGWYRAPNPYTYYINNDNGFGAYPNNATRLIEDTIDLAIADPTINWALLDVNGNGKIDNIVVVHSGSEAAWTGNTNDFWAHQSTISPTKSIAGKTIYQYAFVSEYIYPGAAQRIGVDCHEFGHLLGLPDLYDYSDNSNGIGNYSVMSTGTWANNGFKPTHLDAWSKYKLGFTDIVTDPQGLITLNNAETNISTIKYTTTDPKEYFLIENRQKTLFDTYLSADGIFIWRINENQSLNNNELCFLVGLIQADNLKDLENKINFGDSGDSFPGSTNKRSFGRYTSPNSKLCNGTYKNILLYNISNSGNTMTFNSILSNCVAIDVVSPPNIGAIDMTITKSSEPCLAGTCTVTIDVTWQNTGGASGSFTPSIIIDSDPPITSAPATLNTGGTITRTFSVPNLTAAAHTICPSPN